VTSPLTDQQLDEIAARAEGVREYIDLPDDTDGLAGQDVPALIAEIRRQRTQNTAGRAGLRDQVRRAICEAEGFGWDTDMLEPDEYGEHADVVLAVLPAPADRAAVLREAWDVAHEEGSRLEEVAGIEAARGARCVARLLRRMADEAQRCPQGCDISRCPCLACEAEQADEEQPATEAETDEQRADREETERDHAAGNHQYCGQTCEVEFPTEMLRNAILYRAIPGSKAMLAELERRAAAGARRNKAQTEADRD
jgi:hypothetical protein